MRQFVLISLLLAGIPAHAQSTLPDKPVAAGDIIHPGERMNPDWPANLVIKETKEDGRLAWEVVPVNSCTWCGAPLTWKQAAFDRKTSTLHLTRIGLFITDIELTHHAPCFVARECGEINPLMGQSRLQAYSVGGALIAATWLADAWLRKGDRRTHLGGLKLWWTVPVLNDAFSVAGITNTLATWHRKGK